MSTPRIPRTYGERHTVRFRPRRARVVHAGRWTGPKENPEADLWSLCRNHQVSKEEGARSLGLLDVTEPVTCKECLRWTPRPLSRGSLWVIAHYELGLSSDEAERLIREIIP